MFVSDFARSDYSEKPFVIADERTASLVDWVRCYAHDILRPGGHRLLIGLVDDPVYTVSRLRELTKQPN